MPGPREAAGFPQKLVWAAWWVFRALQEKVSYDSDPSFFSVEVVLTQGIDRLHLGHISKLDEPLSLSLLSSTRRASYLVRTDAWDGEVVTEEMCLLCWAGTCHHCHLPLRSLPGPLSSARCRENRESIPRVACPACRTELSQGAGPRSSVRVSRTPWYSPTRSLLPELGHYRRGSPA